MTRHDFVLPVVLSGAVFLACESEAPEPEAEPTAAPETTAPEPDTAAPVEEEPPSAEELPIPEDFATEAAGEVQEQNYRSMLDRIAAEIESEAP